MNYVMCLLKVTEMCEKNMLSVYDFYRLTLCLLLVVMLFNFSVVTIRPHVYLYPSLDSAIYTCYF